MHAFIKADEALQGRLLNLSCYANQRSSYNLDPYQHILIIEAVLEALLLAPLFSCTASNLC